MVPGHPDSAGNGLLGEDSPVGTVLCPWIAGYYSREGSKLLPPTRVCPPRYHHRKVAAMSLPHAVDGRHPKGTQKDRRLG
jgi:hypothetical protein